MRNSGDNQSRMGVPWQPRQEGLEQILQLLKESQSADTGVQRTVQQVCCFIVS